MASLLAFSIALGSLIASAASHTVAYDGRSFLLDGERVLLLSGSIHYQRVMPADWPRVFALAAEMGLNTVQTYVFADEHQPEAGSPWDFSGRNNLTAFVSLAGTFNLRVVVRIGPYICGEHFNGGVPLWMRSIEGSGATCFRCSDPAWEGFTAEALKTVVTTLTEGGLLWPQGGPVIALQVENEYNGPDQEYLEHIVMVSRNLTTAVPWLLCHDLPLCSRLNTDLNVGPMGAALCTINGFWEDSSGEGVSQPSPAFMIAQAKQNPGQPLSWTEDQAWFDQWGDGQRVRTPSDILYGVARFIAYGGTHHNFYMLTGGSNFGYSAAFGVATAYAYDAAIDSLLLRHEPKFSLFATFFGAVNGAAGALLDSPAASPVPLGKSCETMVYGNVTFVSNKGTVANASEVVVVSGVSLFMPNHTVVMLLGTSVIANTSASLPSEKQVQVGRPHPSSVSSPVWTTIVEAVGSGNRSASAVSGSPPLEQLLLTRNSVDYMFYTLFTPANQTMNASGLEVSTCGGEYVYLFAEGHSVQALPQRSQDRTRHEFALPASSAASSRLDILVSAMGLSTSPSPTSCKGIVKVTGPNGKPDLTRAGWTSSWVFPGEAAQVYTPTGAATAPWQPVIANGGTLVLSWFKTTFDLPHVSLPLAQNLTSAGAPPQQLAYALDLLGATKGVVWVNGVNLGRYNLELGECTSGGCAPPIHGGECFIFWNNCGNPTQRYYHVPTSLLQPTGNLVVLFEETSTVPAAGSGPVAPSPPPRAPGGQRSKLGASPPAYRNLATVALVAVMEHPQ